MILDIYRDSFEFSSKKISNLIILGVLSLFSFLIIPVIIFYGYSYKVIKQSTQSMINGGDIPPEVDGYKEMFINGLKYFVVEIAYTIIPVIIIYLSSVINNPASLILILIGLVLFIIGELFSYLALAHMASNGDDLKQAFDLRKINEIMASIGYGRFLLNYIGIKLISLAVILVFVVIFIVISMTLGISVGLIGSSVSYIMILLFAVMMFLFEFIVMPYLSVFTSRCIGLIYNIRG